MTYDLFVSYAHVDDRDGWVSAFVGALQEEHARFTPRPLRVFFDSAEIRTGDDWEHRILKGLSESRVMLAMLSPAYFSSAYCRREWEHYVEYELARAMPGEGITPIYTATVPGLDEVAAAAALDRWTADLCRRQYLDVRSWRTEGPAALQRNEVRSRLELLDQQINDRLERAERGDASPTTVPAHNRNFVGRLEELRQLKANLLHGQLGAIAAVHGLGGIGKSALAFEYAHAFAADYPGGRFLINAAGLKDFRSAIIQLAPYRGITLTPEEREDVEGSFARVRLAFEQGPRSLLLLDNLDDPSILDAEHRASLLPGGPQVHVLVTTRLEPDRLPGVSCITLGELPLAEGLRLLERHRPPRDEAEWHAARQIVHALGGHPLALEIVAVYLWKNPEVGYVEYFEQRVRGKWLAALDDATNRGEAAPSRHAPTQIGALLQPTLNRLAPAEMLALEYAALLPPDRVPLSWLRRLVGGEFPEAAADPQPGHPDPWRRIERHLDGLRLLVRGESPHVARIHRVVQEIVRSRFGAETVKPRRWTLRRALGGVLPAGREQRARRVREQLTDELVGFVREQADALLASRVSPEDAWEAEPLRDFAWRLLEQGDVDAGDVGYQVSRVLSRAGRYGEDRQLLQRVLGLWESATEPDYHRIAIARGSLATVTARIGNLREARDLYRQTIAEWASHEVGVEHEPELAGVYASLAVVESQLGDSQAAAEARRAAIALRGPGDAAPDHRSLIDAALLARDEGQLEQSRERLIQALALQEASPGADDVEIADTCFNLAQMEQELGRPQLALPLFQRAREIEQRVLSPQHPRIASTFCGLGRCEMALGQSAAAREHFRAALEVLERAFPDGHWQQGTNFILLSQVEEAAGNFELGRDYAARSVEIFSRFFPSGHIEILSSLLRQAACERRLKRWDEARGTAQRVLQSIDGAESGARKLLGPVLNELGVIELETGRNEAACQYLNRAARVEMPADQASQLHRASTLYNLAIAEQRASRLPAARSAMRAALQVSGEWLGANHSLVGSCTEWLFRNDPGFAQAPRNSIPVPGAAPQTAHSRQAEPGVPRSGSQSRSQPAASTSEIELARQRILEHVRMVERLVQQGCGLDEFAGVLVRSTGESLAAHACRFRIRYPAQAWNSIAEWTGSGAPWPFWADVFLDDAWQNNLNGDPTSRVMRVELPARGEGPPHALRAVLAIGRACPSGAGIDLALEVCQRADGVPQAEAGYCRFVDRMGDLARAFVDRHPPAG